MLKVINAFFSGLSKNEKQFLSIASVVVFLALFDRLIVGPITSESDRLSKRIEEKIKSTEKNIRILRYKDRIVKEDVLYHEDYYANENLTREELIAVFLSEVEGMAKSAGIMIFTAITVGTIMNFLF